MHLQHACAGSGSKLVRAAGSTAAVLALLLPRAQDRCRRDVVRTFLGGIVDVSFLHLPLAGGAAVLVGINHEEGVDGEDARGAAALRLFDLTDSPGEPRFTTAGNASYDQRDGRRALRAVRRIQHMRDRYGRWWHCGRGLRVCG